jgi:DNA-directed RNA polymerase subunit RPC12/RpoP
MATANRVDEREPMQRIPAVIYYCVECNCDRFKITSLGEIRCGNCNSAITNLRIIKGVH